MVTKGNKFIINFFVLLFLLLLPSLFFFFFLNSNCTSCLNLNISQADRNFNSSSLSIKNDLNISLTAEKLEPVLDLSNAKTVYEYTGDNITFDLSSITLLQGDVGQQLTSINNVFREIGDYEVTIIVSPSENYNGLTQVINVSVVKAKIDVSGYEWDYSPKSYEKGMLRSVVLKSHSPILTPIYQNNEFIEAGTYFASVSYAYDEEHYEVVGQTKSLQWEISRKSISIPSVKSSNGSINSFVYDGNYHSLEFKDIDLNSGYINIYNNEQINAGNYSTIIWLTDSKNTMWSDNTTQPIIFDWQIEKKIIDIPEIETRLYYNGKAQMLDIPKSELYDIYINNETDVGNYTAVLVLKDSLNYSWADNNNAWLVLNWSIYDRIYERPVPIVAIILLSFVVLVGAIIFTLQYTKSRKEKKVLLDGSVNISQSNRDKIDFQQNEKESLLREYGSEESINLELENQNKFLKIGEVVTNDIKTKKRGRPKKQVEIYHEKKKRGRPKKIVAENTSILPKKRGRPKKEVAPNVLVQRKRGRPKKIVTKNSNIVIKKRGRPRKIIPVAKEQKKRGRPKKE